MCYEIMKINKVFASLLCEYKGSSETDLQSHMLTHTGEKSKKEEERKEDEIKHCCNSCNESFQTVNEFNEHEMVHFTICVH